jgi:trehalose 2-sulfotransferase
MTWHPQFGDIAGLTTAEWLSRFQKLDFICKSIVLATEERTGSEWLCQLMVETGVLGRPSEFLNGPWFRNFLNDYPLGVREQVAIAHIAGSTSNGIFSTKLHSQQFERLSPIMSLDQYAPNPIFVRLTRNDILGQAISMARARQSNQYHAHWRTEHDIHYDADLTMALLVEILQRRSRWELFFVRNGIAPVCISYEELLQDPIKQIRRIANGAGVSLPNEIQPPKRRLSIQRDQMSDQWRAQFIRDKAGLRLHPEFMLQLPTTA